MKGKLSYEEFTKIIRDIPPKAVNPEKLTDSIIENLPEQKAFLKKGVSISSNTGHWSIFIGFRAIAAIAAVLLIGFFAFQQWEIATKMSKLEELISSQNNSTLNHSQVENKHVTYYQSLLNERKSLQQEVSTISEQVKIPIDLNKLSIKQLVNEVERLQEENIQLKTAILNHLVDSLRKGRIYSIKTKYL